MENTDQIVADEAETEARGTGKKAPSPARKGEENGKIGPNGYNRSVENIRHDLGRFEKEHHMLREDIRKTLSLVEQILPKSAPGDLSAFVDRGLMDPISPQPTLPDRNEIARTWEEGKRTVEELEAFYGRLRTQKIWSQEDLEGILTRLESVAREIAGRVGDLQKTLAGPEARASGSGADPKIFGTIAGLSGEMAGLGERIAESRQAILDAIATRTDDHGAGQSCSFDPDVLSPLLRKIGDLEEQIKENRPAPLPDSSRETGWAVGGEGGPAQGIHSSLFARSIPGDQKGTEKKVVTPRIKRLGFIWAMAILAIVAIVARARHSGPPPEPANPVAIRSPLSPIPRTFPIATRSPEKTQKIQSIEPVLSGLDKLREGVGENGQAITDLSGKIDQALAKLPKGASLSGQENRLIGEGRELEWLVKTWPAGPGRKELLRMMGNYTGR